MSNLAMRMAKIGAHKNLIGEMGWLIKGKDAECSIVLKFNTNAKRNTFLVFSNTYLDKAQR